MIQVPIILLLSIVISISGCDYIEVIDTIYQNYADVIKSDAIGKGKWIPEFLPPSAVNIHERHDLDTNEIWLSFRFNYSTDITNIMKACKRVTQQDIVYPRKPGRWWPKTLTRRTEDTQRSGSNYEYYRCEDDGIMAIDRNKVDVFYWHLG